MKLNNILLNINETCEPHYGRKSNEINVNSPNKISFHNINVDFNITLTLLRNIIPTPK